MSPAGSVFVKLSPKTASGGDNRTITCTAQGGPNNVFTFMLVEQQSVMEGALMQQHQGGLLLQV